MNKLLLASASLLAGFGANGLADPSEPPLQVVLTIDGVQQKLTTGEQVSVNIAGKPRDVLVEVAPTRRLEAEGVAFDYPSSMGFEFEHDEEVQLKMWTLDGNDVTLILSQFSFETDGMARQMLESSLEALDQEAELREIEVHFSGKKTSALQARVNVVGNAMEITAIALPIPGKSCILMIQDSLEDDGGHTQESSTVMQLLAETMKIKQG